MSSRSLIISNDQSTIGIPPLATKPPVFVVIYPKWRGILSSLLLWVPTERWSREQITRYDSIVTDYWLNTCHHILYSGISSKAWLDTTWAICTASDSVPEKVLKTTKVDSKGMFCFMLSPGQYSIRANPSHFSYNYY